MPSTEFTRWRERFDARHRFGLPVLPPQPKGAGDMPPTLVALPPRSGSMTFSEEDVKAVIDLLREAQPGQAVRLTDDADDSENTARRRAELMKEQAEAAVKARATALAAESGPDAAPPVPGASEPDPGDVAGVVKPGYKIRGHVLRAGEPTTTEHTSKKGKTYKVTEYPQNWGAVSLVPDTPAETPATPAADPAAVTPDPDATPANQSPDNPAPATPADPEPEVPVQGRQTRRR